MFGFVRKSRVASAFKTALDFLRARYDAASTNTQNQNHWKNADGLSADSANDPAIRHLLRTRARYEVANNSYAKGMVLELCNDVIGIGPRLQMLSDDAEMTTAIEREFGNWAKEIGLGKKLRTMRHARATDGESVLLLTTNPKLKHRVKLDVKLIEADQLSTPTLNSFEPNAIDGMKFDDAGNVTEYHLLKAHPGDIRRAFLGLEYDIIDPKNLIHYFRADRAGQHRGIPDLVPAMSIFAETRRFSMAVIAAAETAADFAAVMKTTLPPDNTADAVDPGVIMDIQRREMLFAPPGWEPYQMKAEQPSTTYDGFVAEKMGEAGRSLLMPRNKATGNSSNYNYASGRMDHQSYGKNIRVEQDQIAADVLDRILSAWLDEATRITGLLPQSARLIDADFGHAWMWHGSEHVDPLKEAQAQEIKLRNNTTTLAIEWASRGLDWQEQLRQRGKEKALERELGIEAQPQPALSTAPGGTQAAGFDDDEESDG